MIILITVLITVFFTELAIGAVILNYEETKYKKGEKDD